MEQGTVKPAEDPSSIHTQMTVSAMESNTAGEVLPERKPRVPHPEQEDDATMSQTGAKPRTDDIPMPSKKRLPSEIIIYPDWCKACGVCIEFCPTHVLERGKGGVAVVAHPEKCVSCDLCEMLCPDFAIMLSRQGE